MPQIPIIHLVCNNCTLTLLNAAEDLTFLMNSEEIIDLNGIPAPWLRLSSYEKISDHMTKHLYDYLQASNDLEDYNVTNIDNVSR